MTAITGQEVERNVGVKGAEKSSRGGEVSMMGISGGFLRVVMK